jgi:hypothetical protein
MDVKTRICRCDSANLSSRGYVSCLEGGEAVYFDAKRTTDNSMVSLVQSYSMI